MNFLVSALRRDKAEIACVDSNTNFVPSSKPVAHLLSFAACCSFIVQRFDAMKHVDSSLRRLHVNVMGLSLSLRQLCFNILLQVPSSIKFKELSQIENLSDPDHEIPLLSLLQKDAQAHIDLFRILSELRKSLDDMGVEVDKLSGRIAEVSMPVYMMSMLLIVEGNRKRHSTYCSSCEILRL
jgi:hypothetical protein